MDKKRKIGLIIIITLITILLTTIIIGIDLIGVITNKEKSVCIEDGIDSLSSKMTFNCIVYPPERLLTPRDLLTIKKTVEDPIKDDNITETIK